MKKSFFNLQDTLVSSTNCMLITKRILKLINVKVTNSYIKEKVLSHPHHASLLCISDILNECEVKNLAVRLDYERVVEMPFPMVAQIRDDSNNFFVVIVELTNDRILYYDKNDKLTNQRAEEFIIQWEGVCLLVEPQENSIQPGFKEKLKEKTYIKFLGILSALSLLTWVFLIILNNSNYTTTGSAILLGIYLILKLIGVIIGSLLMWYEVDQYSPVLQKICVANNKFNCSAVLQSKFSKLPFGSFNWSELGLAYFTATFFTILIYGFSELTIGSLGFLSLSTAPVIILSIYYQYKVIKQWCRLCMAIQLILISEILITLFGEFYTYPFNTGLLPVFIFFFFSPIFIWRQLSPVLRRRKDNYLHKRSLIKLKNRKEVFHNLLLNGKRIINNPNDLGIILGEEHAKNFITMVCSPYCHPCAEAYSKFEKYIESGEIQMQLIFTASLQKHDQGQLPVSHFLAISEFCGNEKTQAALSLWYVNKLNNYNELSKGFPLKEGLNTQNEKINSMNYWCSLEKITQTPTIYIDGFKLPEEYSVEDYLEIINK